MVRKYAFLQTDFEGSSSAWDVDPQRAKEEMTVLFDRTEAATISAGGRVYKKRGDGQAAVFFSSDDAVFAVSQLYADPIAALLLPRLRIVLHAGEAEDIGDEFLGACLNIVGRLLDAGHPGQTLATSDFLSTCHNPPISKKIDRLRLRGIGAPVEVHQIYFDGTTREFPPLRGSSPPNNLPRLPTEFFGRQAEVDELKRLIGQHRAPLVTILGFGGVGKTTLATQFAHSMINQFQDRIWWIRADHAFSAEHLLEQVCHALRFESDAAELKDSIPTIFRNPSLLIFDCFEAAVEYGQVVTQLLELAPQMQALVTSRRRLECDQEHVLELGGIVDTALARPNWEPGIELFDHAASRIALRSKPMMADRRLIKSIIRRVDAIPLAIQLCAGRVNHLSLEQIDSQLAQNILSTLNRTTSSSGRHRSMATVIQASFDLLDTNERQLLTMLASFKKGFDLDTANEVTGLSRFFDIFGILSNSSLIFRYSDGAAQRFRLLDPVIEFISDVANLRPDSDFRERFCKHYERWSIQMSHRAETPSSLSSEVGNLVAAVEWMWSGNTLNPSDEFVNRVPRFLYDGGFLFEFDFLIERISNFHHFKSDEDRAEMLSLIAIRHRTARNYDRMQSALSERYEILKSLPLTNRTIDALGEICVGLAESSLESDDVLVFRLQEFRLARSQNAQNEKLRNLDWDAVELSLLNKIGKDPGFHRLTQNLIERLKMQDAVSFGYATRVTAEVSFEHGDLKEATVLYSKLAQSSQPHTRAVGFFGLGRCAVAGRQWDEAAMCLSELTRFERSEAPRAFAFAAELESHLAASSMPDGSFASIRDHE